MRSQSGSRSIEPARLKPQRQSGGQLLVVVPRQPQRGPGNHVLGVAQHGLQVLERIDPTQLARGDGAAHLRALGRVEGQRTGAMPNRLLERLLGDVVVCGRNSKKP